MFNFFGNKAVIEKLDAIEDRLAKVEMTVQHVDEQVNSTISLSKKILIGLVVWALASGGLRFETLYKLIPGLNGQPDNVNVRSRQI